MQTKYDMDIHLLERTAIMSFSISYPRYSYARWCVFVFLFAPAILMAQEPGLLNTRVANETFHVSTRGEGLQGMQLRRVFSSRALRQPVFLTHAGDGSGRLFAVEREGLVQVFGVGEDGRVSYARFFLVLREQVNSSAQEAGLLSLAFHPDYARNGLFYVYYIHGEYSSRISEFRISADPDLADVDSERILLDIPQVNDHHFGSQLAFGPDGMLYVSLGDNGIAEHAQDLRSLQGSILRIDVDQKQGALPYAIPQGNPLVGNDRGEREEIWAWGFRNPWRFSFDRESGLLWAGDVGGSQREEINIVRRGGNYGWSIVEGSLCGPAGEDCDLSTFVAPVVDYGREDGQSVTGGYVYRGHELPRLRGAYIYGDFVSGSLWGVRYEAGQVIEHQFLVSSPSPLASFGIDEAGELYVVGIDGALYRLAESGDTGEEKIPQSLASSGLFSDVQRQIPAAGIIPYTVNAALWSDDEYKTRFIALPGMGQIEFTAQAAWKFPSDAVLVKNFYIERVEGDTQSRQIAETRLLVKDRQGEAWSGFSYMWNEEGTDAVLLEESAERIFAVIDAEGQRQQRAHYYPSRAQCRACHTAVAGYVLGPRTAQMNVDYGDGTNQLHALNDMGVFSRDISTDEALWSRLPAVDDDSLPAGLRARAYLDANCAHCHQPAGISRSALDLRYDTPLEQMGVVDVAAAFGDLREPGLKLLQPGAPQRSALYLRMLDLGAARMPQLATTVVDRQGSGLVEQWIATMAPTVLMEQSQEQRPQNFALFANYPNPFNAATTIGYRLENAADIELTIYNLSGQRVRLLGRGHRTAGQYNAYWDGRDEEGHSVAAGIYFYRLWAGGQELVRKMALIK